MLLPRWDWIFDILGAGFLARGLIISEEMALRLGLSYFGGDSREENLRDPRVADRLDQFRDAQLGCPFWCLGSLIS
jgi:hypothetical protein